MSHFIRIAALVCFSAISFCATAQDAPEALPADTAAQFDVGDVVEAGGVLGKVNHMSLVNTTFMTLDNQRLIVPNNLAWEGVITKAVKVRFDEEGISIPFPQRDVHVIEQQPN